MGRKPKPIWAKRQRIEVSIKGDVGQRAILTSPGRLTPRQFDLCSYIYLATATVGGDPKPITWSPKAYLGQSPTKSQSATLSQRLKVLVEDGYVIKRGREVQVSKHLESMFVSHAKTEYKDAPIAKDVLVIADFYKAARSLKSIRAVEIMINKSVEKKQLPEEQAENALATINALEKSLNYGEVVMQAGEVIERFNANKNKKLTFT